MKKKYPVISECFYEEHRQPLYSKYYANVKNQKRQIVINNTAADIFRLCNGKNTINDIIDILSKKYSESRNTAEGLIKSFINSSIEVNHIYMSDIQLERKLCTYGDKSFWTPEMLSIELTHNCPLKCKHCYVEAGSGDSLSTKLVKKILDDVEELNIQQIQLTGGEPLLHPQFAEILESLISKNKEVQIFTSGFVFNDHIGSMLKRYNNNKNILFQISIDGLENFHDDFRGIKGAYQKSMSFIKFLHSVNITTIVALCYSNQGYNQMSRLCKDLKNSGVRMLRIGAVSAQGRAKDNEIYSTKNGIFHIRRICKKLQDEHADESFSIQFNEDNGSIQSTDNHSKSIMKNCGMGQTILKVSPEGNIHPCLMSNVIIGNIGKKSIKEIQLSSSRKFEAVNAPTLKSCLKCRQRELCKNCIVQGVENSKIVDNCDWLEEFQSLTKCNVN